MRTRLARLVAALALVAAGAGPALALPGDPGFAPTAPADGAVVPVDANGIPVAFSCPVYRISSAGGGFDVFGGATSYGADMSTSPAVDADGRLALPGRVARVQAGSTGTDTCGAFLGAGGGPPRPQETPGVYYWQVWRLCTGCVGDYEVGPVLRLELRSPVAPVVRPGPAPYAGFPVVLALGVAGAPDGTPVTVQRAAGSRWITVGTATASRGTAESVVVLPRGAVRLRAVARIGSQDAEARSGPSR